ncbi:Phosphatidylglycerophosphatase A [Aquicella siphonis]|uniref:Phosphatidylglycerophosphatase A n=1 Tax=Aquicella siphonis TaxID=254247 RepID=A0A5E4PHQ6_9COXI|nr:phosphatidylglycerophosphatase A [Aquicella siphonis]VVC76539.1 Phosphatidylglycerophosphatase A [Aquicella siphonis]
MARFSVTSIFDKLKSRSRVSPPIPEKVWRDPLYFAAFGFGSGTVPVAPGTFGTLLAIPFYLILQPLPQTAFLIFVILFAAASSWICDRVSREIHSHDHPGMCIDEFAGFFVTMIHAPPGPLWIVLGFLLFRLFDIWKPWPIHLLDQKVHGGFGMVLDDIVAGLFAFAVIQLCSFIF